MNQLEAAGDVQTLAVMTCILAAPEGAGRDVDKCRYWRHVYAEMLLAWDLRVQQGEILGFN